MQRRWAGLCSGNHPVTSVHPTLDLGALPDPVTLVHPPSDPCALTRGGWPVQRRWAGLCCRSGCRLTVWAAACRTHRNLQKRVHVAAVSGKLEPVRGTPSGRVSPALRYRLTPQELKRTHRNLQKRVHMYS